MKYKKSVYKAIQKASDKISKATKNTPPYIMVVRYYPIVAQTKKLKCKWTCDFSNDFSGEFVDDLVIGKKVIVDCFDKCEFTVEHIDNRGKAYLRSGKTCVFANHVYGKKWRLENNFYSLDIVKSENMWFE